MTRFALSALIIFTSATLVGFSTVEQDENSHSKANKSLEIFTTMFREVSERYVENVDPEYFVKNGMNHMLAELDAYTRVYSEDESDELDVLTSGSYIGFGFKSGIRDSMTTVTDVYEGTSAHENGLRIGDRIMKIDTAFVLRASNSELRKYTKGREGSSTVFTIIREGAQDMLRMVLTRQVIPVVSVPYTGFVRDSIGYIALERFSRKSSDEVREALVKLREQKTMTSLILDLRGNPGGLLESAVEIAKIFLPTGSGICTTQGREHTDRKVYASSIKPMEPTLKLCILMDKHSASASEILAGALQDNDRALIVGEQSFGKGLVQTLVPLPYNSMLKMTTARYYTPSGRLIQRTQSKSKSMFTPLQEDTNRIYYTKNGRPMHGRRGISPDIVVINPDTPKEIKSLLESSVFFRFANEYAAKIDMLPSAFSINKKLLKELEEYINSQNKFPRGVSAHIKQARLSAENQGFPAKITAQIEALEKSIEKEERIIGLEKYPQISAELDREIRSRFETRTERIARSIKSDSYIAAATTNLRNSEYYQILRPMITNQQEEE